VERVRDTVTASEARSSIPSRFREQGDDSFRIPRATHPCTATQESLSETLIQSTETSRWIAPTIDCDTESTLL
jgi:hypothetical protein